MREDILLTDADMRALADELPLWTSTGTALERTVTARTFLGAIAWVASIAAVAEDLDHHPDIDIRWRTVRFVLSTHSAGGLTRRDAELARRIDDIVAVPDSRSA